MALRFVEYKKDASSRGSIRPLWLDDGETFYDKDNYTCVGCCADKKVKVPDTIIQFPNKAALQNRNIDLHRRYPFTKTDNGSEDYVVGTGIELTEQEVRNVSDDWWDEIESLY